MQPQSTTGYRRHAAKAFDENFDRPRGELLLLIKNLETDKSRLAGRVFALEQAILKLLDKVEKARTRKA